MGNGAVNELKRRLQEDDELYRRFATSLEQEHGGEFVAISREGEIIVSKSDIDVLQKAMKQFGSGNFAFRRVGYEAIGKWRALIAH
jgi:hypothetical protein